MYLFLSLGGQEVEGALFDREFNFQYQSRRYQTFLEDAQWVNGMYENVPLDGILIDTSLCTAAFVLSRLGNWARIPRICQIRISRGILPVGISNKSKDVSEAACSHFLKYHTNGMNCDGTLANCITAFTMETPDRL